MSQAVKLTLALVFAGLFAVGLPVSLQAQGPQTPACGNITILQDTFIDRRPFDSGVYALNVNGITCAEVLAIDGPLGKIFAAGKDGPLPRPWVSLLDVIGAPKFSDGGTVGIRLQKLRSLSPPRSLTQQTLGGITTSDSTTSSAVLLIGAATIASTSSSQQFSSSDTVDIVATIIAQSEDRGLAADIYVVVRTVENGVPVFRSYSRLGKWEVWSGVMESLPPAYTVSSLPDELKWSLYSGQLTAGDKAVFIGYALRNGKKLVINFNAVPFVIAVSEAVGRL